MSLFFLLSLLLFALTSRASPLPRISIGNENLCDKYSNVESQNGYFINNNMWGGHMASSGAQCLLFSGVERDSIVWSTTWKWQGAEKKVKSFPYAGRKFTPKKVSEIKSLPTTMRWNYNNENIKANVAYDLFTSADPNHETSSGDFEMMIWLARYGDIQPISTTNKPVAYVGLAGQSWELYEGMNEGMKVYSFVAQNGPVRDFNANAKSFFDYLSKYRGFPAARQYLLTFQAGTEPFKGGPATFRTTQFQAAVNDY